jgi:16S rRNA (cytidine1402-2'-O)-methyltransferase
MSQRAVDVLRSADLIAAEDTRHSQRLLQHYSIDTPCMAYHDHSDERALARISRCLADGGSVALVSDAGTPLISDPGYRLVRQVQELGHRVRPVALSASGLPTDRFLFEGFLPARAGSRANRLAELAGETVTLIFYEAPHRVRECLEDLVTAFGGEREAVLAREITKTFETIRRGSLLELAQFVAADSNQQKGEIVLLVAGRAKSGQQLSPAMATLLQRLAEELPAKRAAALVAEHAGLRKKQLYDYLLALKQQ